MKRFRPLFTIIHPLCALILLFWLMTWGSFAAPASGPLRVHPENPRYFTDGSGKAIYLTGSHTWSSLQDLGTSDPPSAFDFNGYLDFLEKHHHNFVRLWRWELFKWTDKEEGLHFCTPNPWKRTGPGEASDGKAKFDLNQFDEDYFKRLRTRVEAGRQRGIYVSVMLFEGWGLRFVPEGWKGHPFHPSNNINGIGRNLSRDDKGLEIFTLTNPAITQLEEAYVRKVVDTVNDLDNVLYEISNENGIFSTQWQYHLIKFIREYEKGKPKQHPIGMTSQGYGGEDDTDRLFSSPADWISPSPEKYKYKDDPPDAKDGKVILIDTDHLWGVGGDRVWVWKSFLRGLNPIWMDPFDKMTLWKPVEKKAQDVRLNLGYALRFAERMNLVTMTPRPELTSSGYCLANPGAEYLCYQPQTGAAFSVELKAGKYRYEWFDVSKGVTAAKGELESAGGRREFKAPFEGDSVLYLKVGTP